MDNSGDKLLSPDQQEYLYDGCNSICSSDANLEGNEASKRSVRLFVDIGGFRFWYTEEGGSMTILEAQLQLGSIKHNVSSLLDNNHVCMMRQENMTKIMYLQLLFSMSKFYQRARD